MDTWCDAPGLGRAQSLLGLQKVRPNEGEAKLCFLTTCLVVGDFSNGVVFLHHRIIPRGRRGCLRKREGHGLRFVIQTQAALKCSKVFLLRRAFWSGPLGYLGLFPLVVSFPSFSFLSNVLRSQPCFFPALLPGSGPMSYLTTMDFSLPDQKVRSKTMVSSIRLHG